ncbi:helix-turn-helix transcriptional regulator [Parabacteroides gordonii]|uniref:helix-turn-helix transcriptional regulator n=1 Tax=Parabacteroides gordonii TaxID=574930 RepID=UPI0026EAFAE9|nr:helix-turn-helix transcriptional regulator [Parabacteroides gordonii]
MGLFYSREHTACFNYTKEVDATFNFFNFKANDTIVEKNIGKHVLVFMLTGRAIVSCNEYYDRIINESEFVLLPVGCLFIGKALEDCQIVTCAFYQEVNLCNRYNLKMLEPYAKDIEPNFHILPFAGRVQLFLDLLILYLEDGINCSHFHEQKKHELFLLIRAYYSKKDQARIFHPIIGCNIDFKSFVLENAATVNRLEDFTQRLNCSLASFKRQFAKHFDISPYQWLQNQKSARIFQDIRMSEKSFLDITVEYGFSSQAHFCKFCKSQFGDTPKQIRNNR